MRTLAALDLAPCWRELADHHNGAAMLRVIAYHVRNTECDAGDVAEALYWLAYDYGGSEWCPLRRASNVSGYRPGLCARAVEPGGTAEMIYEELADLAT